MEIPKYKENYCYLDVFLIPICLIIKSFLLISDIIYIILVSTLYKFNNLQEMKNLVYENPPFFNFYISQNQASSEYIPYKSFYTWKGTYKLVESGNNDKVKEQDIPPKEINKLYQNFFYYKNINKTYFEYLENIDNINSVNQNCKNNYKKCGILDTNNNILCIPINEECPLNDLKISDVKLPDLEPEYSFIEVTESLTDSIKYIYYTNNKTDNNIIIHLELSANNPCIYPGEHNWIGIDLNEVEKSCSCKTYINNELYDKSYKEVGNKILMKSLYYDNKISLYYHYNYESVNLYARNYYYFDKKCSEKYIENFDVLESSYTSKILAIKILQYINVFFVAVYLFLLCKDSCGNDEHKYKIIKLIITDFILLYGLVINIISIVFINGDKLDFSCGNQNINTKIGDIFNEEFSFLTIKVFSIINIIINGILLIGNTLLYFSD